MILGFFLLYIYLVLTFNIKALLGFSTSGYSLKTVHTALFTELYRTEPCYHASVNEVYVIIP